MCSLMDYYRWADAFKPAALTRFVERLAFQVGFIKNNYWSDSNHRISQAQAVTLAGLLFPEMKQASEWVTNGSTILNEEIVKQYFADGWLKDNDLHYHIGSIESFRSAMSWPRPTARPTASRPTTSPPCARWSRWRNT